MITEQEKLTGEDEAAVCQGHPLLFKGRLKWRGLAQRPTPYMAKARLPPGLSAASYGLPRESGMF